MGTDYKPAKGSASFRGRLLTYAGVGVFAAVVAVGTAANGDGPGIAAACIIVGALAWWLGRRSAMESASAEAHAVAVAHAASQSTSAALAGVQVNLAVDGRSVELLDASGQHRRTLPLVSPPSLSAQAFESFAASEYDKAPEFPRGPSL